MSRKNPFPYRVQILEYREFYDIDCLNKSIAIDGEKINWLKVKWFRFQKDCKEIGYKYDVSQNFQLFEPNPADINWGEIVLHQKYNT